MSTGMIAMLWPWGAGIPAMVWTIVFGSGAARFAALAMSRRFTGSAGTTSWCHALMFASMVVMAWSMNLMQHGPTAKNGDGVGPSTVVAAAGGHHHSGAATTVGAAINPASMQLWCLANAVILLWVGALLIVGFVNDSRRSTTTPPMMMRTSGYQSAWATSAALITAVKPEVATVPPRVLIRMFAHVTMTVGMAVAFLQMI